MKFSEVKHFYLFFFNSNKWVLLIQKKKKKDIKFKFRVI